MSPQAWAQSFVWPFPPTVLGWPLPLAPPIGMVPLEPSLRFESSFESAHHSKRPHSLLPMPPVSPSRKRQRIKRAIGQAQLTLPVPPTPPPAAPNVEAAAALALETLTGDHDGDVASELRPENCDDDNVAPEPQPNDVFSARHGLHEDRSSPSGMG